MTDGRRAALLATLVVALSALALVAKFPSQPLIFVELNNAAHAPVFGALAIVWLQILRRHSALGRWQRYIAACALSIVIGGLIELIQPVFNRGSERLDLITDALGAFTALVAMAAYELRRPGLFSLAAIAFVPVLWPLGEAALAYHQRAKGFPTLLGYDANTEQYFIHSNGIEVDAARLPSAWRRADDPQSYRIRIRSGSYPRITLIEPQPDWRGYSKLMLDVTNPERVPLTLTLRVHDEAHDKRAADRFNRRFTLAPYERRVLVFPMVEVASSPASRGMDMSRIASVIVFGKNGTELAGREYYLTRLWLE
jgi:VanZ family protein